MLQEKLFFGHTYRRYTLAIAAKHAHLFLFALVSFSVSRLSERYFFWDIIFTLIEQDRSGRSFKQVASPSRLLTKL